MEYNLQSYAPGRTSWGGGTWTRTNGSSQAGVTKDEERPRNVCPVQETQFARRTHRKEKTVTEETGRKVDHTFLMDRNGREAGEQCHLDMKTATHADARPSPNQPSKDMTWITTLLMDGNGREAGEPCHMARKTATHADAHPLPNQHFNDMT